MHATTGAEEDRLGKQEEEEAVTTTSLRTSAPTRPAPDQYTHHGIEGMRDACLLAWSCTQFIFVCLSTLLFPFLLASSFWGGSGSSGQRSDDLLLC